MGVEEGSKKKLQDCVIVTCDCDCYFDMCLCDWEVSTLTHQGHCMSSLWWWGWMVRRLMHWTALGHLCYSYIIWMSWNLRETIPLVWLEGQHTSHQHHCMWSLSWGWVGWRKVLNGATPDALHLVYFHEGKGGRSYEWCDDWCPKQLWVTILESKSKLQRNEQACLLMPWIALGQTLTSLSELSSTLCPTELNLILYVSLLVPMHVLHATFQEPDIGR